MDPLTALSIASNVIQLVEFSAKLVSEGRDIYKSAEGTLAENEEAEAIAQDLTKLNDSLSRSLKDGQNTDLLGEDDRSLVILCEKCEAVARELLEKLNKVKVSGRHRKWKSAFQALKNVSSRDELERLAARLESYRSEITLHTVVSLRKRIDLMSLQQSTRFDGLEKNIMSAVLENRTDVIAALSVPPPAYSTDSHHTADLHQAAYTGDRPRVRTLLNQAGTDASARNEFGQTALHLASVNGHSGVVQTLLAGAGAIDLEAEDNQGRTALHCAAASGHAAVLRLLLMKEANRDALDDYQATPLSYASRLKTDKHDVCVWIFRNGYDVKTVDERGNNLLMVASYKGADSLVQDILARTPNTEVRGGAWITPLIAAASQGKHQTVRVLLEKGAEIETKDPNGATALIRAAWRGHTNAVMTLVESGANVEAEDSSKCTSLQYACRYNHIETVRALLERGAQVKNQYLETASENGRVEIVTLLLERGAEVEHRNEDGMTALMLSAYRAKPLVTQALLDKGADPEQRRNDGATALWIASESGHERVVEILLRHGVDVESKGGKLQYTSLTKAAQQGNPGVVRILLNHGADIESRNSDGVTALMEAAWINKASRIKVARVLLDKGADIESRDVTQGGFTPLIRASRNNHHSVAGLLVERGADLEAKTLRDQRTALAEACFRGHSYTVRILLGYGADVESRDRSGKTPLMLAAALGNERIIDDLLRFGAFRAAKDSTRMTAFDYASREKYDKIAETLR